LTEWSPNPELAKKRKEAKTTEKTESSQTGAGEAKSKDRKKKRVEHEDSSQRILGKTEPEGRARTAALYRVGPEFK